ELPVLPTVSRHPSEQFPSQAQVVISREAAEGLQLGVLALLSPVGSWSEQGQQFRPPRVKAKEVAET
ncbi:hypothetical protein, partial [Acidovorax sp.]|uniref:hypothetical protein n=1 Tax=Acidovorax sp. TaxID=1872122 RepID=UPI00261A0169